MIMFNLFTHQNKCFLKRHHSLLFIKLVHSSFCLRIYLYNAKMRSSNPKRSNLHVQNHVDFKLSSLIWAELASASGASLKLDSDVLTPKVDFLRLTAFLRFSRLFAFVVFPIKLHFLKQSFFLLLLL